MSIGYACLTVGVKNTEMKSCMQKNASDEKLLELIEYNLNSLENIINYNIKNNIKLFRISSDLIPFGSSPVNKLLWEKIFQDKFTKIGKEIRGNGIRVSMHPGQYTVLNSPNNDVVFRAVEDLNYHYRVLEALGVNNENKIVLHIGGIYGDKQSGIKRFIENFNKLDSKIKGRIVIENDHKSYNINDVLEIGNGLKIPVIFDNLHHKLNPHLSINKDDLFWIKECGKTWTKEDGNQKIHYSEQHKLKGMGSHSDSISINEFIDFWKLLKGEIDIMLEVKDKNLSAVKCINCTRNDGHIVFLENEWSKYKYNVLECSPIDYLNIRKLLKEKKEYPAVEFYNLLEHAFLQKITTQNSINAAQHVWGYFKDVSTTMEKQSFLQLLDKYKSGLISLNKIKANLERLAVKYNRRYLMDSYYFLLNKIK
ncbi:MAG: UV DNA damage repair endonuclease UvsE [Solirubrobacterales bacterium]